MSSIRFAVWVFTVGVIASLAPPARADSISIDDNFVIERSYTRASDTEPQQISKRDCEEDANIRFPVTIQASSLRPMEIWSGREACNTTVRRDSSDCNLVKTLDVASGTRTINITSQEIVGAECTGDQTSSSSVQRALFFAFLDETGSPSEQENDTQTIVYDVVAPGAPNFTSLGSGDGLLVPHWDVVETSDLIGYSFYCDSSASIDLSNTGAAGQGGAASDIGCTNSLVEGQTPDDSRFCGRQAGQRATRGTISDLNNEQAYAVGVVSTDFVGNVGVLSNIRCQTPHEVTDFYEAYTAAGGKGGGGFCSLTPGRAPSSLFGVGIFGMLLVSLTRRKLRS